MSPVNLTAQLQGAVTSFDSLPLTVVHRCIFRYFSGRELASIRAVSRVWYENAHNLGLLGKLPPGTFKHVTSYLSEKDLGRSLPVCSEWRDTIVRSHLHTLALAAAKAYAVTIDDFSRPEQVWYKIIFVEAFFDLERAKITARSLRDIPFGSRWNGGDIYPPDNECNEQTGFIEIIKALVCINLEEATRFADSFTIPFYRDRAFEIINFCEIGRVENEERVDVLKRLESWANRPVQQPHNMSYLPRESAKSSQELLTAAHSFDRLEIRASEYVEIAKMRIS